MLAEWLLSYALDDRVTKVELKMHQKCNMYNVYATAKLSRSQ